MMKAILYLTAIVLLLCCCKSKEKVMYSESEYMSKLPVIRAMNSNAQDSARMEPGPRLARPEKVVRTNGVGMMHYYIIVGSFSVEQNAVRLRASLMRQGFLGSTMMRNAGGMYRVSILSGDNLTRMQAELERIRDSYAPFYDAWLLEAK